MSFKDKVVIVTGASSGMGAATAIAFATEGAKVVMVGRNQVKLNNVAEKCKQKGSKPLVVTADLCVKEDIKRIMKETIDHFGKLDVLVNNAGAYTLASILDPKAMEVHERMMATNLQAAVHLTHLAAPYLIKTKGNIVSVSDAASTKVLMEDSFSYLTAKAGLDQFSRAVALELAPKGVRVNTVNPGVIKTDLIGTLGVASEKREAIFEKLAKMAPLKRVGDPEEIADLILFLASDRARSITGSSFVSDNGQLLDGPVRLDFL